MTQEVKVIPRPGAPVALKDAACSSAGLSPSALERMASALAASKPQDAITLVDAALQRFPNNAELLALGGEIMIQLGDNEMAALYFDEALKQDPEAPRVAAGRARIAVDLGHYQDALEKLRPALRETVSLSPSALRSLEEIVRRGNIGGEELLQLVARRGRDLERLTSSDKVGDLHRLAQQALGRGLSDGGPGRYARTSFDRLVHCLATPIDRVAARVAPRPDDESEVD